jgi:uncharacterized protein (TIGR03083 family)
MTDVAAMTKAERVALRTELEGLDDEQWSTMTVCAPWTVRHLVAHMTALGNQTVPHFMAGMIGSGFNFDKLVNKDLARFNEGSNADVLARFSKTVEHPTSVPGLKYVALGEIMCHGEDIRRAIGRKGEYPAEHLVLLADRYRRSGAPLNGKKRVKGLRLRATDVDWTFGDGPEVAGPAMDLILAMSGRGEALDSCSGDGVATMRSRC